MTSLNNRAFINKDKDDQEIEIEIETVGFQYPNMSIPRQSVMTTVEPTSGTPEAAPNGVYDASCAATASFTDNNDDGLV